MSILDRIQDSELTNPFDIISGKVNGETTVVSKGMAIVPESVKIENRKIEDCLSSYDRTIESQPVTSKSTGTTDYTRNNDKTLVDYVVKQLKGRSDYMSVISEIIYKINDK